MDRSLKYFEYLDQGSEYYVKPVYKPAEDYTISGVTDEWVINKDNNVWTMYSPRNKTIPVQGWKIHVSTAYGSADETLGLVSKHLLDLGIPFKHVRNKGVLHGMLSKHGSRVSAGKFFTVYPDPDQFIPLLNSLREIVLHLPRGPYILTDKQFKESNVYYRYGAFVHIQNDKNELCIYDNHGNLIPDERNPSYHVPDFVKEPEELLEPEPEQADGGQSESRLRQYNIESALRFSNAGGIYSGTRISDGKKCIIKEARAEVGLDGQNKTAAWRLENEYKALTKLKDVEGIVQLMDYFTAWENVFLVEEFVEGIPLAQWLPINYPFSLEADIEGYFNKIKKMMDGLKETVKQMHSRGVAMCDLQTHNVIVSDDLRVNIIDFEIASDAHDDSETGMFTKGFVHPLNKVAKDRDWYALNRIFQFCFLPIGAVYDLDMRINKAHCLWIHKNFGPEAYEYFHSYQMDCCKNITNAAEIFMGTYTGAWEMAVVNNEGVSQACFSDIAERLTQGLLNNCDTESESLINGDISQFDQDCGMLNLQSGGFGAVLALLRMSKLNSDIGEWIEARIPQVFGEYNDGFLTGRAGIACTLYECGYRDDALKLADAIIESLDIEPGDVSLRSGLAGIGLALTAMYHYENNPEYLSAACDIAAAVSAAINNGEAVYGTDPDSIPYGLLDGPSGVSVFMSLLYSVTGDVTHLEHAADFLQKDIDSLSPDGTGGLQILDNKKRLLPYLSLGSLGVGVAITIFNGAGGTDLFQDELKGINGAIDFRVCVEPYLLAGAAGMFIADCISGNDGVIEKTLEKLRLFLIDKKDAIYSPGKWNYRLSSDLFSGSAGILLGMSSARDKDILGWLPLISGLIKERASLVTCYASANITGS